MIQQDDILYGIINIAGEPIIIDANFYTGDYQITPKVSQQILQTSQKVLTANMVINAIPYAETPNLKGITVTIGGISNGN